jgi:lipopolysaccharide transport system ATP-binding protein
MDDIAIRVTGLGKRYRIGAIQDSERTFAETLRSIVLKPIRSFRSIASGGSGASSETFVWALKDISFEVKRGEAIGVIGHNGAGKSTLLKILTRITNPTDGRAEIRGRVGSLLEVGTGFNGELTGRENIFMSGAILGMRKREIDAKFDEIVDFSGVEKFIDTPVKRYSSGMYLRLAFAVAAHLEPEVLLVDEVLAVGDAEFQKKCLGKMGDVTSSGRTILFVSHNMSAVQRLCPRSILLEKGCLTEIGDTPRIIDHYLSSNRSIVDVSDLESIERAADWQGMRARIISARVLDAQGQSRSTLARGEPFSIEVSCRVMQPIENVGFLVGIDSVLEQRILTSFSLEGSKGFSANGPDDVIVGTLHFTSIALMPGAYFVTLGLMAPSYGYDHLASVVPFQIEDVVYDPSLYSQLHHGFLQIMRPNWEVAMTKSGG